MYANFLTISYSLSFSGADTITLKSRQSLNFLWLSNKSNSGNYVTLAITKFWNSEIQFKNLTIYSPIKIGVIIFDVII